jgi:hypothetical protein
MALAAREPDKEKTAASGPGDDGFDGNGWTWKGIRSVELAVVAELHDLVLQLQLSSLELGDPERVRRGMRE